jgi:hypothetical protein
MPQNLKLKIRIWDACEQADMQMLSNVWNETDHHFDVCGITNGDHTKIR